MYTYLAFDGKYYKIGKSKNPEKRIGEMKTANPLLKLITYTDKLDEKYLHRLFAHKRISGEYFKFDKNEFKYVLMIFNDQLPFNHHWYIKTRGRAQKFRYEKSKEKNYQNYKMPFGKYKGIKLIDIDNREYLKWVYLNCELKGKLKEYLIKKLNLKTA